MRKYIYTIKIPFEAIDDVGARLKISEINQKLLFYSHQPESKRIVCDCQKNKGQSLRKVEM